jgi:hypothetical protein
MAYVWQRWLAREFRAAGLEVIEVDGWENRGRPASTGHYDPRHGVTNHHTGVMSSDSQPGPTLGTLVAGRSDLPGPLAPWSVRHDGVVVVIAAGRCNHAGTIGKPIPFAVLGADGNALFMGDEIDTNGTQQLPPAQRHAVAVTNAVYLKHFDLPIDRVHRHADISGTGKWDLGSLTTQQLRDDAATVTQEDDMPSMQDLKKELGPALVRQLLNEDIGIGANNKLTVAQALRQAAKADDTRRDLAKIGKAIDGLVQSMKDDATRAQAQRIRKDIAALEAALTDDQEG